MLNKCFYKSTIIKIGSYEEKMHLDPFEKKTPDPGIFSRKKTFRPIDPQGKK